MSVEARLTTRHYGLAHMLNRLLGSNNKRVIIGCHSIPISRLEDRRCHSPTINLHISSTLNDNEHVEVLPREFTFQDFRRLRCVGRVQKPTEQKLSLVQLRLMETDARTGVHPHVHHPTIHAPYVAVMNACRESSPVEPIDTIRRKRVGLFLKKYAQCRIA